MEQQVLAAGAWRDWANGRQPVVAPPPIAGLTLTRWRATDPQMEQPPLDHHLIAIHLGGPKRVFRKSGRHVAIAEINVGDFSPLSAARDMTTDRPDATESPFTVDAGRVQLEAGLVDWARTADGEAFGFAESNIRIGLSPRLEIDLIAQPYGLVREGRGAPKRGGVGALTLRAKYNLFGNDDGNTAAALLPWVAIPLDRHSPVGPIATEWGVLVPFAIAFDERISLGLNTGLKLRRPQPGRRRRASVPLTASLGVAASAKVGAYYELAAELGPQDRLSLNTGLTWRVQDNVQLDTGIGFGLTRQSDRAAPFVGVSVRF